MGLSIISVVILQVKKCGLVVPLSEILASQGYYK